MNWTKTTFKGRNVLTDSGSQTRRLWKKMAHRDQRRANHKETWNQFYEDDGQPVVGPWNVFSPIPHWMMTEWERAGMEYWRQLKSIYAMQRGRGILAWKRTEASRQRFVRTSVDDELEQKLQTTLNDLRRRKS